MKIVFIGTVDFSYQALQALITNEFNIVGVITKKKSNFNADFCDLTPLTEKHHIPTCFKKKDNEEEIISFLKKLNPDVIFWLVSYTPCRDIVYPKIWSSRFPSC